MEIHRPSAGMFEPATYQISILGTLDKKWSDYCCGMTIEHDIVLNQYPVTILTGVLVDQAALNGSSMRCMTSVARCFRSSAWKHSSRDEGEA